MVELAVVSSVVSVLLVSAALRMASVLIEVEQVTGLLTDFALSTAVLRCSTVITSAT